MQLSEMRGTLSINSSSRNRICGNVNKFQGHDFINTKTKTENIREMCLGLIRNLKTTVLQLTKVLGHLISSIQAVVPARLHYWYLLQEQIKTFQLSSSKATFSLGSLVLEELQWWMNNISLSTGRSLIQLPPP